jgi:hypothetical protein
MDVDSMIADRAAARRRWGFEHSRSNRSALARGAYPRLLPGTWVKTPHGEAVVLRDEGPDVKHNFGRRVDYRWREDPKPDWRRTTPMWRRDHANFKHVTVLRPRDAEGMRITRLAGDSGCEHHLTETQFRRWADFAVRMAETIYADHRRPDGAWILGQVEEALDLIYHNGLVDIVDWDENVGDEVTRFLDEERPYFYSRIEREEEERAGDDGEVDYERLQERECAALNQWDDQYGGPVRCCLRAGIDMAAEPGGGVIGFTVGHLRRMYPEGIPSWVQRHYEKDFTAAADDDGVWL